MEKYKTGVSGTFMHPSSSPVATVVSVKLINRYIGYLFHPFNMCQINVSNKSRFRIGTYSCAFSRRLTAIPVSTSVARTEQSDEPVRITDTGARKHVTNHFDQLLWTPEESSDKFHLCRNQQNVQLYKNLCGRKPQATLQNCLEKN